MKKIFNFKKKKGSPSPSETGSVLSASYDVKEKDLGKVHKAAFSGDVVKLRQLAKKNDLNQLDKENRTALHIACACGHRDVVQFLVESKVKLNLCDNQNRSALMKAVQCEQDRSVSLLLDHEADPNLVDINGNTALHLAARIPSLPVTLQLLEHSANINVQNKDGNTPLMLAVMENHADMTELLLKEGADVNVKNQEQRSALMIAACNGQISMVRLLLQYDADITVKDDKGWSSDDYAVMNGHHACSHLIIEHGTKRRSLQSPSHFTASKKKQTSVLGSPGGIGAGLALGGPALDKDAAGSSSAGARKDTEDHSHTESISRASKSGAADSWPSSDDDDDDDDELDLSPKKQKVNLKQLISTTKREKVEGGQSELKELPSGSKLDVEGNESPEDESEEGEDDEGEDDDGEEEEEEEEEEGEDDDDDENDENEDDEEDDDEEGDEQEETAVACETTGLPGLPKTVAIGTTEQSEMANENVYQPGWDMMEDSVSGDSPLKVRTYQEEEASEKMDMKETISEKMLFGGLIPGILNLEDGCLVSAVSFEARFSDEEDNKEANDSPSPPAECETSLPSVDRTSNRNPVESKNENQSDDDVWEDDDDEDEELLKTEKNILEVEPSQGTAIECDPQLLDETDDVPLGQNEGITDLDTSNLDVPSASPKSKAVTTADDDEDDWDDVDEEEEVQTKMPLNLFLTLLGQKEPESPEVSWESGSDKSDGMSEGDKESNMEMPNAEKDQNQEALVQDDNTSRASLEPIEHLSQSPLHEEPGCIDQSDDSGAIPVSMIVGQSDEDQSISQEHDSQVKQMQYDFASGSVKVSEIDQISDVSDNESLSEEYDVCINDADLPQASYLSNSSPKCSATSSPAQFEKPLLMRSLSNSPKPLNAMSPVPTSPSPKHAPSPRQSAGLCHQHSTATSPQNSSSSNHSPSPLHCSPSTPMIVHLDQDSQDMIKSTNPESPQHSSPDSQVEDDLSVEFADERSTEVIEPEPALQEEIPYTVIDEVDLTSDSDEDDGEEQLEKLHEQNSVNKSVMEERRSKHGSLQEEASTEDEEEEDEREEPEEMCEKAKDPQNGGTSKEKRRDFLSELGLEKEDENDDSPWDSESGSESPRKKQASAPHTPAKSHRSMSSIYEEYTEVLRKDEDDEEEKETEIPPKVVKREIASVLSKLMDSKEANKKTDLMEELGLGDADDLEDASDWDSASTTSKASKKFPVHKLDEEPVFESPAASGLPITSEEQGVDTREHKEASPERNKPTTSSTTPLPSPRSLNPNASSKPLPLPRLRLDSNQRPESEESDWDLETSSPAKMTNSLPNVAEPDTVNRQEPKAEDVESEDSSYASEDAAQAREALQASSVDITRPSNLEPLERPTSPREDEQEEKADEIPWEERYEKIWVENNKKETKSQYRNVAAELKERFGELEHKEPLSDLSEQEWKEDEQGDEEEKKELEKEADDEDSSEEEGESIVRPIARARSAILLPIPEQRESSLEDSQSESVHRTVSVEVSDAELPSDQHNPQIIPEALTDEAQEPENRTNNTEEPESGSKDKCPLESASEKEPEELHRPTLLVENELQVPPKVLEVLSSDSNKVDEGLWKSRLEGNKEQLDGMRGEQQPSALWDTRGTRERGELDQGEGKETDNNSGNPKPQQEGMADGRSLGREGSVSPRHLTRSPRSTDRARPHGEEDEEEEKKTVGSQARNLHVAPPLQGKPSRPATHHNGDLESVFDDSTLSELSEEDRRSPSSRRKKEQSTGELEMADDFEDLTQSSDTATEELETPVSGYHNASLLFKQLDSSYLDSVSVVKLQNMFHEYERTIQRERDRHSRLADKTSRLEQERNEFKILLDDIRGSKSSLEHLKLELETDMNNLKFLLRQEQEKHQSALMLYNKTREQLQRKEEQQRAEAEECHKAELKVRSLELEIRALKNSIKQLEEDRDESQSLLSHERSARALQEELLNNHLRKQQNIEKENLRNLNKSNEAMSQLTEASDRERELMQQNRAIQDELNAARAELDHSQCHSRQEESRLAEERDVLRERLEDARRDMKLSEEALAQTVFQYNGQLSALKAECSVITAKREHERQVRQQLEAEAEASRARLQAALQEAERCQASRTDAERTLQRDREEHQRAQEKHIFESSTQRDTIQSLSQKLSKAEARANSLENECHRNALTIAEKGVLLETLAREKDQALAKLKELEATVLNEREQASRAGARQEAMQERLAQAQSENALLRQQLEEALNKGSAKDKAVTDVHQNFAEMLNQLRADGEERVHLVEERSKELAKTNSELRDQNYKLEQEKADRESSLRQLQQELADCLKKLSMCEASLEVNTRYRNDLEEEKARTLKDMDRLKGKLQESEEVYVQAERRISQLKSSLDDKEREACSTAQKLEEALAASTGKAQTIKQLEEAVQRLEIENARLEATAKQQTNRIEVLQKGVQEGTVRSGSSPGEGVRNRLEDIVTNLQSGKMTLEEQLNREVQKQSMLSHNAQDSQALWEEELKSRSRLGLRLSELEKEKGELTNQMELEKKKAKKLAEQKKSVDTRLEQEMKRNTDLQKEMLKTLLKTAKKQLREQGGGQLDSPLGSFRGDMSHRLEAESTISRMKTRVDELQSQYEREASRCSRLEEVNRQLKEKLSSVKSLSRSHEQLERSKRQLEEEVASLRRQLEAGVMDQSQAEQYRRETEERARQEIRHKLEEVNLFLQTQAASQEALEQMKAANEASQRTQQEQRIRDLEGELSRLRSVQQDSLVQRDSSHTELERYKQLYSEELRLRKSLAAKLERSNERLAEANTKLLSERQRSKSLLNSSIVNGGLGGPALDVASLGTVGAYGASLGPLNRSLGLGTPLLGTVGESQSSRVEAYLAKMQTELEKNISKELDYGGTARMSPVGSASGSQNLNLNVTLEQPDPVSRATQQYLEVLKKNYMI
ncbi:ankyrin repeat domain-containing protein 26-like isoform X3 [Sinocyclocheilus grahami]|uniref:ankyrin repeat domain-containing protein 26-like isoform X3 n=1 Tax=Sinocyclocheilus grahami TaxID=75366 RepID=UPI0007AD53BB|nr:PREDICTED: ankyrin repeat domain-containing protein 26-like isoform X3 [Sinocyclocheilus grahami]